MIENKEIKDKKIISCFDFIANKIIEICYCKYRFEKIRKPKIISISNQIIKNILIKYFRYQPIIRCKIKKKKK